MKAVILSVILILPSLMSVSAKADLDPSVYLRLDGHSLVQLLSATGDRAVSGGCVIKGVLPYMVFTNSTYTFRSVDQASADSVGNDFLREARGLGDNPYFCR